jgi:hypothetical protein
MESAMGSVTKIEQTMLSVAPASVAEDVNACSMTWEL